MSDKNDQLGPLLLFAALLYFFSNLSAEETTRTIYFRSCRESVADIERDISHNVFSCPGRTYVSKQSFRVFPEQQRVVSDSTFEMTGCVVFDRDNWRCSNGEDWKNYENMRDGDYFRYTRPNETIDDKEKPSSLPVKYQIPTTVYHVKWFFDFIRGLMGSY